MSSIDDIMASIPISALAGQLGVDEATAESAVRDALPALVGGLQANAADPAGAASLAGALDNHSPKLIEDGVNLDDIDTDDGQKIVQHVFGNNADAVAQTLGGNLGGNQGLIQQLLPMLAPIALSYLTKQFLGGQAQTRTAGAGAASGGLEDMLGSILGGLGGPGGGQSQAGGAGSILDVLGGLLGGGRR